MIPIKYKALSDWLSVALFEDNTSPLLPAQRTLWFGKDGAGDNHGNDWCLQGTVNDVGETIVS